MVVLDNISFSLGSKVLLDQLTFAIENGAMLGILGPNGAGKSTLLKLIAGAFTPTTGSIAIDDITVVPKNNNILSTKRAVLSQNISITFSLTVREVVMLGRYPYNNGRPTSYDSKVVNEALGEVGMLSYADRNILQLSGGEQQRVHIARVLAQVWPNESMENKLILLDEPNANLDINYQHEMFACFKKLNKKFNYTIVAVVHDLNLAGLYMDQLMFLKEGRVVANGNTSQMFKSELFYKVFSVDTHVVLHPTLHKPQIMVG